MRSTTAISPASPSNYDGGPVGIETLSAALSEPRDALEEIVEPFLLQQGFIGRTPRGRVLTLRAYKHLGLTGPGPHLHAPDRPVRRDRSKRRRHEAARPSTGIAGCRGAIRLAMLSGKPRLPPQLFHALPSHGAGRDRLGA